MEVEEPSWALGRFELEEQKVELVVVVVEVVVSVRLRHGDALSDSLAVGYGVLRVGEMVEEEMDVQGKDKEDTCPAYLVAFLAYLAYLVAYHMDWVGIHKDRQGGPWASHRASEHCQAPEDGASSCGCSCCLEDRWDVVVAVVHHARQSSRLDHLLGPHPG